MKFNHFGQGIMEASIGSSDSLFTAIVFIQIGGSHEYRILSQANWKVVLLI
jgi:hypothetical protein